MKRNVGIFAILFFHFGCVAANHGLVLTVSCNQHSRFGEYLLQSFHAVHKHVACTCAHKQFHAADVSLVKIFKLVGIIVRCPEIERIVHHALGSGIGKLVFQSLDGSGLRIAVRHIHERSHTSGSSCSGFCSHISLVCKSRVAEMHMVVNHSRKQEATFCVNGLVYITFRRSIAFDNSVYCFILSNNRAFKLSAFVHDDSILYPNSFHLYILRID